MPLSRQDDAVAACLRPAKSLKSQAAPFGRRREHFHYGFRMALAVASSVINPLIRRPFSAALIAGTLAGPTTAPMVRASAGTCGGMLVRRALVPPLTMRPFASNAQPVSSPTAP